MSPKSSGGDNQGRPANSAGSKQLVLARTILLIVGVLTATVNIFIIANPRVMVKKIIEKKIKTLPSGRVVDLVKMKEVEDKAVRTAKLVAGTSAMLGFLFIVLGIIVTKYPVPVTILALILYIGGIVVFGFLEPLTVMQGWIIKLLIIFGLVKSLQSTTTYRRSKRMRKLVIR